MRPARWHSIFWCVFATAMIVLRVVVQHIFMTSISFQVDSVSNKMEEMKREYESRLEHYAQLLDARAARVKVTAERGNIACSASQNSFF